MKLLFAIAVIFGMVRTGIDVKGAFLYPDQERPVYIRVNFMIEQIRMGSIEFEHVFSEKNVADILTKLLGPTEFLRLRGPLLGEK